MKTPRIFLLLITAILTVMFLTHSSDKTILASESSTVQLRVIDDLDDPIIDPPELPEGGNPNKPGSSLPQVNGVTNHLIPLIGLILTIFSLSKLRDYRREGSDEKIH